jgi:hypothetical protein
VKYIYNSLRIPVIEQTELDFILALIKLFSRQEVEALIRDVPQIVRTEFPRGVTLLHESCRLVNIELTRLLEKAGGDLYFRSKQAGCAPIDLIIDREGLSSEQWSRFLAERLECGLTRREALHVFQLLKILSITPRSFSFLPLSLQNKIKSFPEQGVGAGTIKSLPELQAEVDFSRRVFEIALHCTRRHTFFGRLPKGVAPRIMRTVRVLEIQDANANADVNASAMVLRPRLVHDDMRRALIEKLTECLDSGEGSYLGVCFLREALKNPSDENKDQVRELLGHYVNVTEERFQALYRNCLEVLGIEVKPREAISPPVDVTTALLKRG